VDPSHITEGLAEGFTETPGLTKKGEDVVTHKVPLSQIVTE
jgi:hypothetical protein